MPVASPKNSAVKSTNPIVPPVEIRPTTSSASVSRPWAWSPAVTASSRMTSRPPAPATSNPAPTPAVTATVRFQK